MHGHDFLYNLALVLGVAAVTTVVSQRLRLPVVFGYLLAGLIVGPHVPLPVVADEATVHTLSELGVILLMFSMGLEFSVRRLFNAGGRVIVAAVLPSSFMLWLGYEAGRLLGWGTLGSLYAGAAIAVSSTTIVVRALAESGGGDRASRELVFGILVVEDLVAILLLALLTPAASGTANASVLGVTIVRLVAVLAALLAVGMLTVPRLVRFVIDMRRAEITLVVSVGICFAMALLVRAIGYSVALGAFLAGSLVSESGEAKHVERLVEPVRDVFAAIFFVSVGMMIEPLLVAQHAGTIALFLALVVFGMTSSVALATFLTGAGIRTAIRTGLTLAPIGEFSFIIAAVGIGSGAAPAALYPVVITVSALTTLATPWLVRHADEIAEWVDGRLPRGLQTFAVLYGTWIEKLRTNPETTDDRRRIARATRALAIDAGVAAAIGIGASVSAAATGPWLAARTGWPLAGVRWLVPVAAVLLALPFLVGIVRTGRALGLALSRRAFAEPDPRKLDPAAAPRRSLVVAVQLTTVLAVGAPLAAILQPFLPPFVGIGVLIIVLVVLGVRLSRTASDLQGHVRAAAEAIVSAIDRQVRQRDAATPERSLERAYELVPGLGEPVPVRIEAGSPCAGRRLADVALRGLTGASVIAISRGDDVVLVPDGHEELREGDVVALAGPSESIAAARALLTGSAG